MDKVTYLLGAGASKFKIPLLKDLHSDMNEFADNFKNRFTNKPYILEILKPFYKSTDFHPDSIVENYTNDIKLLANIINESGNFNSIDAYANTLIQNNDMTRYNKTKSLLSSYLHLKQIINIDNTPTIDRRYSDFLLSLRNGDSFIESNVNVLSWNYDIQIELAYNKLFNHEIWDINKKIPIHDRLNYFPNLDLNFNIFKINGSSNMLNLKNNLTNYLEKNDFELLSTHNPEDITNILLYLFKVYISMNENSNFKISLDFSWSYGRKANTFESNQFLNLIRSKVVDSKILVIIGYSFHSFNSAIDKYLLASMPNLKKIIIQDMDTAEIKRKIKSFDLEIFENNNFHFEEINISLMPSRSFEIPNLLFY